MDRKLRAFGLVAVLVLAPFLTVLSVTAAGEFYTLEVVFENREYEVGEQVNFTAMVWLNDQLTSVDDVTGYVFDLSTWPPTPALLVNFAQTAQAGIYEGNFTIAPEHVGFFNGSPPIPIAGRVVLFLVEANVGGTPVQDQMTIVFVDFPPSYILEVSNPEPVPGETVSIDLTIMNQTYVDADIVNITVYNSTTGMPDIFDPDNMPPGELLSVTPNGTGRYNALYTIPSTLQNSTYYSILINATFNGEYINYEQIMDRFFPKSFIVNMLEVYVHLLYEDPTQIIFDVYVTDLAGGVVAGADLDLQLFYDNGSVERKLNTTDGLGKAGFDLTFSPAVLSIVAAGWANFSGLSQFFTSAVIEDELLGPESNEFEVISIENEGIPVFFKRGETVSWNYTAYNNSQPLAYQEIYYWIWNFTGNVFYQTRQLVETGNVTTDANGNFTLTFTIPQDLEKLAIEFRANVSQEVLKTEADTFFRIMDENLIITYDTLNFGNSVNITADVTASNDTIAFLILAPLIGGNQDMNWSMPLPMTSDGFPSSTMMRKGMDDKYHRRINLPAFWPITSDYMIFVAIMDRYDFELHGNYTVIELSPSHVLSHSPSGRTSSRLESIVVEFDEEINVSASIDPVNITSTGTVPTFTITWSNNNKTMMITFDDRVDYDTNYTIRINSSRIFDMDTMMLDGNNNDLMDGTPADDYVFTFISPFLPSTLEDYDGLWHNTDIPITLTAKGGDEGINETKYKINNGATMNVSIDGMPVITSEGANNTLEYWSVDNAATVETHHILNNIKLDKTPPTTSDDYDGQWHSSDITIIINASDTLSGVSETYYKINDGTTKTVSADGQPVISTEDATNKLEYWAVDNAANEETHHTVIGISLDKTPPSVTITSADGVVSGDFVFEATITDANLNGSSIAYQIDTETNQILSHLSGDTYQVTIDTTSLTDGTHAIKVIANDNAGNVNDTQTIQINVDNTAPAAPTVTDLPSKTDKKEITLTGTAEPGSEIEVFLNDVSVGDTTAGDDGKWSLEISLEDGENAITVESRDAAGNTGSSEEYSISLLKEAEEETNVVLFLILIIVAVIVVLVIIFLFKKKKKLPAEAEFGEENIEEEMGLYEEHGKEPLEEPEANIEKEEQS